MRHVTCIPKNLAVHIYPLSLCTRALFDEKLIREYHLKFSLNAFHVLKYREICYLRV